MQDLRQSPEFCRFMEKIGWQTKECKIENVKCKIFIKKLPLLGSFIKICRPSQSPLKQIDQIAKKYHAFAVQITYSPTKTLQLDLTQPEEKIFAQFKKDARYAIRKAQKNKLQAVKVPLEDFYNAWKKNKKGHWIPPFSWINALKNSFNKNFYQLVSCNDTCYPLPLAGVILLKHDRAMYYYFAFSSKEGRKLFAPYFLVWETIKLAKKNGCRIFDFEGIYDKRFPQKSWLGFSHFKKSFGGKEIEYHKNFIKFSSPILNFLAKIFYGLA